MAVQLDSLFKITYGLFLVSVEFEGTLGGCIVNTVSQITAEPPRLIVTMQKSTFTSELIQKKGSISVSVLSKECPLNVITHFGYQSGRNINKFAGMGYRIDSVGNPYLAKYTTAVYALKIEKTIDVETHLLFICSITGAKNTSEIPGITYDDYRVLKSGGELSNPIQKRVPTYVCAVCHYIYDGEVPFDELPDDYKCPICGVGKDQFFLQ